MVQVWGGKAISCHGSGLGGGGVEAISCHGSGLRGKSNKLSWFRSEGESNKLSWFRSEGGKQ